MERISKILKLTIALITITLTACGGGSSSKESPSVTTPPSTPTPSQELTIPTLNITTANKHLTFSWPTVSAATHYKLLENRDGQSGFIQHGENLSAASVETSLEIGVHLHNWNSARYILEACDATTCVSSSELSINQLRDTAIIDLLASDSLNGFEQDDNFWSENFGSSVTISSDGNTLAIAATEADIEESSLLERAGLVFIYKKNAGVWEASTIISAPNPDTDDNFGFSLSLNGSGTVLAVGVPSEDGSSTTPSDDNLTSNSGAVYIYRYSDNGWGYSAYLKADTITSNAEFGSSVALDETGNTLAIGSPGESNFSTGLNAPDRNESSPESGAAYAFVYGSQWTQEAYIKSNETLSYGLFGDTVDLSSDGNTLVVNAYREGDHGKVYWYSRSGSAWQANTAVEPDVPDTTRFFGRGLSISGDGNTLVVGATLDHSGFGGINGDRSDTSSTNSGAVLTYQRNDNQWQEDTYFKAELAEEFSYFGMRTAVNEDGRVIAIKVSGAMVSVFEKDELDQWSQTREITAGFEKTLALDASGNTLVLPNNNASAIY